MADARWWSVAIIVIGVIASIMLFTIIINGITSTVPLASSVILQERLLKDLVPGQLLVSLG